MKSETKAKTVFIAAGNHIYACTVRESAKCWLTTEDSSFFMRDRRYAKDKPVPWSDTPVHAAEVQLLRRQQKVERLERDLVEAKAEHLAAFKLTYTAAQPDFLIDDRRTGQPVNAKALTAAIMASK